MAQRQKRLKKDGERRDAKDLLGERLTQSANDTVSHRQHGSGDRLIAVEAGTSYKKMRSKIVT